MREILSQLDRIAKNVPLAAFGQTPLWDEPMKAILATAAGRRMIVGIHGLDYFSRIRAPLPDGAWQIVPSNDGTLRETWIAAGELSALFGAEVCASRQRLIAAGVRMEKLSADGANIHTIDRMTEGWGWRGIVQNTLEPSVLCDVSAREVAPVLSDLIQWGIKETAHSLADTGARRGTHSLGQEFLAIVKETAEKNLPLTQLYEQLLRLVYKKLLGDIPANVDFRHTCGLFRFNIETAHLPRFGFLKHFLHPKTADVARAAYEASVANSAMVSLSDNGPGAIPFDLYIPKRGRGNLQITDAQITIGLPKPICIKLDRPIRCVARLAKVLEKRLGKKIALVPKAILLPVMIASEHVMVLTETGSVYIPRTRTMLRAMRDAGIPIKLHPLLRVKLETWKSLSACDIAFKLPQHMAHAFGQPTIQSADFARRWRTTLKKQQRALNKFCKIHSPYELVEFLSVEEHELWFKRLKQCMKANAALLRVQERVDNFRHTALDLRSREDEVQAEIKMLERQRGEFNRTTLRPLKRQLDALPANAPPCEKKRLRAEHAKEARHGKALLMALETKQIERRRLMAQRQQAGNKIHGIERGATAMAARKTQRCVYAAAAKARLKIARDAILAIEGLQHANDRPAAWWMPAVDPSGQWFDRIRRTARFHLESLMDESP